ncbi:hypothetical protein HPB50_010033 [Hyalomma asiaticum]|uniref:Uncharacterized protein n=1 Tax=Hyalomma asiaticum TaxID=266040 RepID=A0ACB7SFV3_HYAAI|nr:hypothetical protein HPB50_010033 [Hyalomma asiaticum]
MSDGGTRSVDRVYRYRGAESRTPVRSSKWPDDGSKTTFWKRSAPDRDAHGQRGWLRRRLLGCIPKPKAGDYHEEMDGHRFEGRFNDVLQKLPAGSVIALDNASYQVWREEKLLKTTWKKEKIQEWLTSKNIAYGQRMIKKQLLELVASVKSRFLSYIVDNTADWRKSIQHVMDLEAKFRLDTSGSEHIQPILIQLGEDDTEENDSDCELSGIEPLDEA